MAAKKKKQVAKSKKPAAKKAAARKPVAARKPAPKAKAAKGKTIAQTKTKAKAKPVVKNKAKAKPAAHKVAAKKPSRPAGMPEALRDAALKVLDERQAEDVMTFDMSDRSAMADYMIVASGRAARQMAAIAHYLGEAFEKLGVPRTRVEGLPEGNWVLVDGGDVIVHLFLPEVRKFYDIESIWNKRPASA